MSSTSRKRGNQRKKGGGRHGGGEGSGKNVFTPPPPPPLPTLPSPPSRVGPVLTSEDGYFTIEKLSLQTGGHEILSDESQLDIYYGRRYALLGPNGSGKSVLLSALGDSQTIPIPAEMTVCYVAKGVPESDISVLDVVMGNDPQEQRNALEDLIANSVSEDEKEEWRNQINDIVPKCRLRAGSILAGFCFNSLMLFKKTREFSSPWRMRIALAKALYARPQMLLLDNPTKLLDFEACKWLTEQLSVLQSTQIIISNDDTFLANVCTEAIEIDMHNKTLLQHYSYNCYIIEKAQKGGSTQSYNFTDVGISKQTKLVECSNVDFWYSMDKPIFKDLTWTIKLSSRIALVGPHGSGKSTMLKLLSKEFHPQTGTIVHMRGLCIQTFGQNCSDMLDQGKSGIDYMRTYTSFYNASLIAAAFGLSQQVIDQKISCLSDGQRTLLILAAMATQKPHLLLLDEATTNLDSGAVDCLAEGLKKWDGAVVIAGHDTRLISLVANEIWVCGKQKLTKEQTCNIMSYRDNVIKTAVSERCFFRVSSYTGGLSSFFSYGNYDDVAISCISYHRYLDIEENRFREPTVSIDRFIKRNYMTASVPCSSLEEGFLQIPGETGPAKQYRVATDVSKRICSSLLRGLLWLDIVCKICLSDFTRANIVVTQSGHVKFIEVRLLRRSDELVRRNLASARTILRDLFSYKADNEAENQGPPLEIEYLLQLMTDNPEKREIFHCNASLVPLSNQGELFVRFYDCLFDTIEPSVRESILENLPHASEFEKDAQSNAILNAYFLHNGPNYYKTQLPVLQQGQTLSKKIKVERAQKFCLLLRNRKSHKMEHFRKLFRYLGDMADLVAHVRFPQVNGYLHEKLFDAGAGSDLMIDDLVQ